MKKDSLGDKYKKSIIRINKLEKDKKALIEQITKLSKLSVDQSLMIGERNITIQKLKGNIDKDTIFDEDNKNKIKYIKEE